MKKSRLITMGAAFIVMCISFGLAEYFDKRCVEGCLSEGVKVLSLGDHFNFTFDDSKPDADGKGDVNISTDLPLLNKMDHIVIKSVSTDWLISTSESATKLKFAKTPSDMSNVTYRNDDKTFTIELKSGAAQTAEFAIPKGFKGDVEISSVSGNINIADQSQLTKLKISTASGDIEVDAMPAEEMNLESISGSVRSTNKGLPVSKKLSVHSTSGDIEIKLSKAFEQLKIDTVSGTVDLEVAKDVAFKYDLHSISGEFDGLPAGVDKGESVVNKRYSGKIGDPTLGDLHYETVSGDFIFKVTEASAVR